MQRSVGSNVAAVKTTTTVCGIVEIPTNMEFTTIPAEFDLSAQIMEMFSTGRAPTAQVHVNYGTQLGRRGSFKTCHLTNLEPWNDTAKAAIVAILGDISQSVAGKRWYTGLKRTFDRDPNKAREILRLNHTVDELTNMLAEAKCHFLGSALMLLAQQYVCGESSSIALTAFGSVGSLSKRGPYSNAMPPGSRRRR